MSSSIPPLPPNYHLHDGYPAVTDYLHLRAASGLSPKTAAQVTAVAQGSWYGCYVTSEDKLTGTSTPVGMGRIIGDRGWYFYIADIAVLPDHQRKGLGDIILKMLLAKICSDAPEGKLYVNLLADPPGRKLYVKNGFVESAPKELGMMVVRFCHVVLTLTRSFCSLTVGLQFRKLFHVGIDFLKGNAVLAAADVS